MFCILQQIVTVNGSLLFIFVVFEGDDRVIHLAASSERDRDSWIEHLHISSYECMKMQLESLREQLRTRTGRDPIENPEPTDLPENLPGI